MSKINDAIHEIHTLDSMARENQWMNRIHPLVKLVLTISYIAVVVSFGKYDLTGLLGMIIYPLVIFITGDISVRDALRRMRIVLPLVCIVGLFNPFFDRQILTTAFGVNISGGVISMVTLMLKGILTVLAGYLLIATTTIEKICYAMRIVHLPKIFVTQILLVYRYITVLLSEVGRITQAYALRAPGQKGVAIGAWGPLVGQLLLRSMDRAEDVYDSMCLRGYTGDFYPAGEMKCRMADLLFLLVWLAVLVSFRVLPVFETVGKLFV